MTIIVSKKTYKFYSFISGIIWLIALILIINNNYDGWYLMGYYFLDQISISLGYIAKRWGNEKLNKDKE